MVLPDQKLRDPYESTDVMVCPHCMASNGEHQHFCRQCGTPITSLSVTDPIGYIHAEGDTYRKAIASPQKPIILIGMWLLFLPMGLGGIGSMIFALTGLFSEGPNGIGLQTVFAGLVFLGSGIGAVAVAFFILYRLTRNFMRMRSIPPLVEDDQIEPPPTV